MLTRPLICLKIPYLKKSWLHAIISSDKPEIVALQALNNGSQGNPKDISIYQRSMLSSLPLIAQVASGLISRLNNGDDEN